MRPLIVTVTTPEGEIIDRETIEVSYAAQAIVLTPIDDIANFSGQASKLEILGLAASEL